MNATAFDRFHPAVALFLFAALLVFAMAVMQPVYLGISLSAALALSAFMRGWRATLRTIAWQVPLIALIAFVNPLFSASGSTELFRIGSRAFYAESLVYGACMGVMLATTLLWFSNAARVLSSDKIMALFGNTAPTIGLMVSMVARLVPKFVRRGSSISDTQQACTSARSEGLRDGVKARMRMTSVLMGWGMEDSLDTADAMRARGWGSRGRRTTYARWRFRTRDGGALGLFVGLVVINIFLAVAACAQFRFYPTVSSLTLWWGYVPYGLLVFAPLVLEMKERIRWRR